MGIYKVQLAIMAFIIVCMPFLNISTSQAFISNEYVTINGNTINGNMVSFSRPKVVAQYDNVTINARFNSKINFQSVLWQWDICGQKFQFKTTVKTASRQVAFNNAGRCNIKIVAQGLTQDTVIVGSVESTDTKSALNVLPVEIINIKVAGPNSAKVGEVFWLESAVSASSLGNYSAIKWTWDASGACYGSSESWGKTSSKIGQSGTKKGTCTVKTVLTVYYPNKAVKGYSTKNITIN